MLCFCFILNCLKVTGGFLGQIFEIFTRTWTKKIISRQRFYLDSCTYSTLQLQIFKYLQNFLKYNIKFAKQKMPLLENNSK
jgi:hypothetical protein